MAVALDVVSAVQSGAAVASLTWTHTPSGTPTGVAVRCYGWSASSPVVSGVTYGGNAMTKSVSNTDATGDDVMIYSLVNPPSGAQSVVLTMTFTGYPVADSVTVTGGDTTTQFSNTASGIGNNTALTVTVTSASGELVIAVGGQDSAPTHSLTYTGGGSADFNSANSGLHAVSCHEAGAASVTESYTSSDSAPWAMAAASFKAAASSFQAAWGSNNNSIVGVGIV